MKYLLIFIFLIGTILTLNLASADLNTPTSYWKFNEAGFPLQANDTQNVLNLTVNNTVTRMQTGKLNNSIRINNSNVDAVVNRTAIPNALVLDTNPFSIGFWINGSNGDGGTGFTILGRGGSSATKWTISTVSGANNLSFAVNNAQVAATPNSTFSGSYNRVWIVREGTGAGQGRIYQNNVNTANFTLANNLSDMTEYLRIGTANGGSLGINLDDIRIYNNYALTVSDINSDWNGGTGAEAGINTVNLLSPSDGQNILGTSFNFTSSINLGSMQNVTNASLYLYNSTSLFTNPTNAPISSDNRTEFFVTSLIDSTYTWGVYACGRNSSNGIQCFASQNNTFTRSSSTSSTVYNTSSYETALESFTINVSLPLDRTLSAIYFYYNGTQYTATTTSSGGNNYTARYALDVPLNGGVKNLWWGIRDTLGLQTNTSAVTQATATMNFTICGAAPQNVQYLNISFKNETISQERVNASISASITYFLGSGSVNKTLTYVNTSYIPSYSFCSAPQNRTLYTAPTIQYFNAESPLRTYSTNSLSLTNITTNLTLYLLPSSAGSYVTFQVVTESGSPISGAAINVSRSSIGIISTITTDSAGSATFFLDPTVTYTITVAATGYDLFTTSITPTQSSYTITLGGATTTGATDYTRGVTYSIKPINFELNNNTVYNFNFTIASSYWGLDSFGFIITNSSGYVFASSSSSASAGGTVSSDINTGRNQSFIMNAFWVVNGTYNNITQYWVITNTADTGWSIANLFTDLKTYLNDPNDSDGLFGLKNEQGNNFSMAIIIFLAIFTFAGIMSYKYGLTTEGGIAIAFFAGTLLFDVGLGIVPNPVGAVPYFPTIFMGFIVVIMFLKEAYN